MQETNVYFYITPIALIFILLEIAACFVFKRKLITFNEAVANFGTQLGNQTTNILVMVGVFFVYGYLWENFRIFTIPINWWSSILLLLGVDFVFYWVHRWGHEINILWAAHSPHHSAEEMNFFVALRASVTQRLFSFLFYWPLVLVGFPPEAVLAMVAFHLVLQFIPHTRVIPKLPRWVESWLNTPSHHRVHHATNVRYLDKNHAGIFIIWDRLFGTFAAERDDDVPVYGLTTNLKSFALLHVAFHEWAAIWRDVKAAPGLITKLKYVFMPPGYSHDGSRLTARQLQERAALSSSDHALHMGPHAAA